MDKDSSLSKTHVQPSGLTQVPDNTCRRIKTQKFTRYLTCRICSNICKAATTINECNHTFCEECIYQKVQEGITSCPECKLDLSELNPEDYLRPDTILRGLIEVFLGASITAEPLLISPATVSTNEWNASEDDGKGKKIKKKRDKKRRRRQFPCCQNNDEGRNEPDNECDETLENIEDLSESEVFDEDKKKSASVWFHLVPQEDETGHVYQMLAKSYIYTKNGDANASIINKLLAQKLNLESEDEVEVCFGRQVIKKRTLTNLMVDWMDSNISTPPEYLSCLEPEDRVIMKLTYRRKKMPECPNKPSGSRQSSG